MGLPEKLAYLRFHHHGNMCSLNNILYQLGIMKGDIADKKNKEHLFKALEAWTIYNK